MADNLVLVPSPAPLLWDRLSLPESIHWRAGALISCRGHLSRVHWNSSGMVEASGTRFRGILVFLGRVFQHSNVSEIYIGKLLARCLE